MKPMEAEARPPYVTFEMRPKENRAMSREVGYPVYDDEPWVIVTPQGSKDRLERVASEWFEQKQADVAAGRFPQEWLRIYKQEFDYWKAGEAIPEKGQALKNWPMVTKGQVATLIGMNIRTVEDLAVANEEAILRLGMGGRALKQRAQEYLETAKSEGVSAARITALETEKQALAETVKRQGDQLAQLLHQLSLLQQGMPTQAIGGQVPVETHQVGGIALSDIMDEPPAAAGLRL